MAATTMGVASRDRNLSPGCPLAGLALIPERTGSIGLQASRKATPIDEPGSVRPEPVVRGLGRWTVPGPMPRAIYGATTATVRTRRRTAQVPQHRRPGEQPSHPLVGFRLHQRVRGSARHERATARFWRVNVRSWRRAVQRRRRVLIFRLGLRSIRLAGFPVDCDDDDRGSPCRTRRARQPAGGCRACVWSTR